MNACDRAPRTRGVSAPRRSAPTVLSPPASAASVTRRTVAPPSPASVRCPGRACTARADSSEPRTAGPRAAPRRRQAGRGGGARRRGWGGGGGAAGAAGGRGGRGRGGGVVGGKKKEPPPRPEGAQS